MTAIAHSFVRSTTPVFELAVVTAFSLAGVVLSLAALHFGFDVGTGIPG